MFRELTKRLTTDFQVLGFFHTDANIRCDRCRVVITSGFLISNQNYCYSFMDLFTLSAHLKSRKLTIRLFLCTQMYLRLFLNK